MNIAQVLSMVRPNIQEMKAYSSARDEYQGSASVFLDANESPYPSKYNRYPDPKQQILKERLAELKSVATDQIIIGNGSDEILDLIFRCFCQPGRDAVLTMPPTYGMYQVLASLNDIENIEVNLNENFEINTPEVLARLSEQTKLICVCSPNNPSGNVLSVSAIESLLGTNAIVLVDEAYIDFADRPSWASRVMTYPNLIVCQTLSKAYGLAGLRLGMAIAHPEVIALLNRIKPPYNISQANIEAGLKGLEDRSLIKTNISTILEERESMVLFLNALTYVKKVYPSEANFLLVQVGNARDLMEYTREAGIILRDRSSVVLCDQCVRISIGTPTENQLLKNLLKSYKL